VNTQETPRHRHIIGNQNLELRQKLKKQQMVIHQQKNNQAHSEALLHLELQQKLEKHRELAHAREQQLLEQLASLQVRRQPFNIRRIGLKPTIQADKDNEIAAMAQRLEREKQVRPRWVLLDSS
jgi:hypothetical protein